MTSFDAPVVEIPSRLAEAVAEVCSQIGTIEDVEREALAGELKARVVNLEGWISASTAIQQQWRTSDHVVVRTLSADDDGASLVVGSLLLAGHFRAYRGGKIVKRFTMSPWTTALSHTLAEGHFHTDLNTRDDPPRATAIQCVFPDPSGPAAGELRVARLGDLLSALEADGKVTLRFLREMDVTMVSDSESGAFHGHIVDGDAIRFHPETLRAGERREGNNPPDMEEHLETIKQAALGVSRPIHLGVGDALFVSNRRALHYRAACTVRFRNFPRDFESRSIHVLHLMDEPT